MIILHDPHADFSSPKCRSAARIVEAVSHIMDAVYTITNTWGTFCGACFGVVTDDCRSRSYNLMLLDHYTLVCLVDFHVSIQTIQTPLSIVGSWLERHSFASFDPSSITAL
jgi:hypothetical protein